MMRRQVSNVNKDEAEQQDGAGSCSDPGATTSNLSLPYAASAATASTNPFLPLLADHNKYSRNDVIVNPLDNTGVRTMQTKQNEMQEKQTKESRIYQQEILGQPEQYNRLLQSQPFAINSEPFLSSLQGQTHNMNDPPDSNNFGEQYPHKITSEDSMPLRVFAITSAAYAEQQKRKIEDKKSLGNQLATKMAVLMDREAIELPLPPILVMPGDCIVDEPDSNDVLAGRGSRVSNHMGNVRFRELVKPFKAQYLHIATKKIIKAQMCAIVVNYVRNELHPPGRFLEKDSTTGKWIEIGDEKARKKAGQTLREHAASVRAEYGLEKPYTTQRGMADPQTSARGLTGISISDTQTPSPFEPDSDSMKNSSQSTLSCKDDALSNKSLRSNHSVGDTIGKEMKEGLILKGSLMDQRLKANIKSQTRHNAPAFPVASCQSDKGGENRRISINDEVSVSGTAADIISKQESFIGSINSMEDFISRYSGQNHYTSNNCIIEDSSMTLSSQFDIDQPTFCRPDFSNIRNSDSNFSCNDLLFSSQLLHSNIDGDEDETGLLEAARAAMSKRSSENSHSSSSNSCLSTPEVKHRSSSRNSIDSSGSNHMLQLEEHSSTTQNSQSASSIGMMSCASTMAPSPPTVADADQKATSSSKSSSPSSENSGPSSGTTKSIISEKHMQFLED